MREQIPITDGDESIKDLLGGLNRVEAPENFEFGVKSRIAKGEPKESGSPFAWLKVAVPTAALAGLAMFLYVSGFMSGDIPTVEVADEGTKPAIAETQRQLVGETDAEAPKEPAASSNERNNEIASTRTNGANNKARSGSADRSDPDAGGGSIDQTLNPDRPLRRVISVQKVLETVGISASFQGDRCVANSVAGQAERLGIKGGDVILAVNGVSIKPSTTFEEGAELKSIRVKRAGRDLRLNF